MIKLPLSLALAFASLFCLNPACLKAQDDAQVSSAILHRDSLFWQAYNACDLDGMKSFFTDDIEFYHDKGGITMGSAALITSLRQGLCSNDSFHTRREPIPGTIHVFPMRKSGAIYGAVLTGDHRFYVRQSGKHEHLDGQAKFTDLWVLKDGEWKMARVLSYDHGPAQYINQRSEIILPDSVLHRHAGSYKGQKTGLAQITAVNGHLDLTIGTSKFILYAQGKDSFFTKERDLTFTFTRDGPGPERLVVRENGDIAEELVRQ